MKSVPLLYTADRLDFAGYFASLGKSFIGVFGLHERKRSIQKLEIFPFSTHLQQLAFDSKLRKQTLLGEQGRVTGLNREGKHQLKDQKYIKQLLCGDSEGTLMQNSGARLSTSPIATDQTNLVLQNL